MLRGKRGQGHTFFIIVAAAIALVLLIVMLIIANQGIGGPFKSIFSIGTESGNKGEFCADVNDQNLCENFAKVKCNGLKVDASKGEINAPLPYGCKAEDDVDKWDKADTEYICIGRKGCASKHLCCHTK